MIIFLKNIYIYINDNYGIKYLTLIHVDQKKCEYQTYEEIWDQVSCWVRE